VDPSGLIPIALPNQPRQAASASLARPTFVDWEQDSAELPDWQTGYKHLVADGRSADFRLALPRRAKGTVRGKPLLAVSHGGQ
jgi:hypothetical protein